MNNIRVSICGWIRIQIFVIWIIFKYYSNTELFAHLWPKPLKTSNNRHGIMKNQSGTIKTNLELYKVVIGGSGGYRRLPGGSAHFSLQTDRTARSPKVLIACSANIWLLISLIVLHSWETRASACVPCQRHFAAFEKENWTFAIFHFLLWRGTK